MTVSHKDDSLPSRVWSGERPRGGYPAAERRASATMKTALQHIMGMPISVDVRDEVEAGAVDEVFAWLRTVDEIFSTYKETSEICRLDRGELELCECRPVVREVLQLCDEVRRRSNGSFSARPDATGRLDPSGMVKGWAVEHASGILFDAGSKNHCINAGGDVRMRGAPEPGRSWHVGIVHPFDRGKLTTVVEGVDFAVATSGTSERGLHVSDPHTGAPVRALASVTVVGPELTFTDAYATAALAMGLDAPEWLATLPEHEAYVIDAGGHVWWTARIPRLRAGPHCVTARGPARVSPSAPCVRGGRRCGRRSRRG